MYLFFDTETTGLPSDWNAPVSNLENWPRLVQLAYIFLNENGQVITKKNKIIKPSGFTIPSEASDIHGISQIIAEINGEDLDEVIREFDKYAQISTMIIGHNIEFDAKILGAEFLRLGKKNTLEEKRLICTMKNSTEFCKIEGYYGYKWPKLAELHNKLFGTNFDGAHNAMVDVEITAKCFWELKELNII